MNVANEILDAIEIIVDKKIREQATQIYSGICKNVNGDSCVMFINGKNNTVQFYGPTPIVGAIYKVFVPYGNMSSAFAITGIVAKSDDEDDKKDLYYSNPNLLDNWYFANPVNQRGQVKYTDSWAYSIDRWLCAGDGKVTIADGHCVFYGAVDQGLSVEMSDILGCTMTASLLLTDGTLITGTAVNTDNSIEIPFVNGVGGVFIGLNATDLSKHRRFRTYMGTERAVIAAKLELGSQQTLAHQDADGNWVLNEIPDYGEQLARCQRYALALSKQSGHSVYGSGMINAGQNARIVVPLPVTMRTAPTVTKLGDLEILANGTTYVVTSVSVESLSPTAVCIVAKSTSLSTKQAATPALLRSSGGGKGELFLSADL